MIAEGGYWGIKAISPNGNVFDIKVLDLEEGGELIHVKAVLKDIK